MQITSTEEQKWLAALQKGDEKSLELIFNRYYKYLVVTAFNILQDDHRAKDLVQDVFFNLWNKRDQLNVQSSLKFYLRKTVANRCIDELRRTKKWTIDNEVVQLNQSHQEATSIQKLQTDDLQTVINQAIDSLPERCRQVFALSRFEDLSHKEIAAKLDISVKTIENQITKALKTIRAHLEAHGMEWLLLWYLFII